VRRRGGRRADGGGARRGRSRAALRLSGARRARGGAPPGVRSTTRAQRRNGQVQVEALPTLTQVGSTGVRRMIGQTPGQQLLSWPGLTKMHGEPSAAHLRACGRRGGGGAGLGAVWGGGGRSGGAARRGDSRGGGAGAGSASALVVRGREAVASAAVGGVGARPREGGAPGWGGEERDEARSRGAARRQRAAGGAATAFELRLVALTRRARGSRGRGTRAGPTRRRGRRGRGGWRGAPSRRVSRRGDCAGQKNIGDCADCAGSA
jgi:hypothetical protein